LDDNFKEAHGPNPVDLHVGARVRMRRKFLGMSQEGLAESIELTFQQVQKYERGSNRISASKLFEISTALKAPVAYFFEGYGQNEAVEGFSESESEQFVHGFLMTTEGIELAEAFPRIKNAKHRRRILELVRALAEGDDA
jgi:transcriptional regulator with XRE-family HTH domain